MKGRGIAQLVERRSPKPQVPGSSPGAPANRLKDLGFYSAFSLRKNRKYLYEILV